LFGVVLLFSCASKTYAAGVDVILLVPVGWLIALVLAIISIFIAPNKLHITKTHLGSILFYLVASYWQEGSDWTFIFLLLYPIASSIVILIYSLILKGKLK